MLSLMRRQQAHGDCEAGDHLTASGQINVCFHNTVSKNCELLTADRLRQAEPLRCLRPAQADSVGNPQTQQRVLATPSSQVSRTSALGPELKPNPTEGGLLTRPTIEHAHESSTCSGLLHINPCRKLRCGRPACSSAPNQLSEEANKSHPG